MCGATGGGYTVPGVLCCHYSEPLGHYGCMKTSRQRTPIPRAQSSSPTSCVTLSPSSRSPSQVRESFVNVKITPSSSAHWNLSLCSPQTSTWSSSWATWPCRRRCAAPHVTMLDAPSRSSGPSSSQLTTTPCPTSSLDSWRWWENMGMKYRWEKK